MWQEKVTFAKYKIFPIPIPIQSPFSCSAQIAFCLCQSIRFTQIVFCQGEDKEPGSVRLRGGSRGLSLTKELSLILFQYLPPFYKKVGPSFTKEFSLIGEENKLEKLRVKEKSSLFNKNFKVNKTTYQQITN